MFMSLAQQPRKEEKQERQIYYCKFPKSKIEWLNKLETRAETVYSILVPTRVLDQLGLRVVWLVLRSCPVPPR